MRIANALAPAQRILTDVGYANVVRNADGTYNRDFSTAGTATPFLSFPDIDYGKALGDTIAALFGGIQKKLGSNPTPNTPNVLANLLSALLGGDLGGILGGVTPLAAPQTQSLLAATDLPSISARLTTLSTISDDESSDTSSPAGNGGPKTEESSTATELVPAGSPPSADDGSAAAAAEKAAVDDVTAAKHAKDDAEEPSKPATDSTPKHAKPEQNLVRESPNFSANATQTNAAANDGKDPVAPATPAAPAKESEPSAAA